MVSIQLTDAERDALGTNRTVCPPGDAAHVTRWREEQAETFKQGDPWLVVPVARHGHRVVACDVAYGHDMLYDGSHWHDGSQGVFLPDAAVLSNYYGYDVPTLFLRAV